MRVVLREDIGGVGKRGDIVEVARGFAQNFLLRSGRAIVATDGVVGQAAAMRRTRDLRDLKDRQAAEAVAGTLATTTVTISARAASEGRLFGSVTSADVADAVNAQAHAIVERRQVILEEPIKEIGTHSVAVRLHNEVTTFVTVEVVAAK